MTGITHLPPRPTGTCRCCGDPYHVPFTGDDDGRCPGCGQMQHESAEDVAAERLGVLADLAEAPDALAAAAGARVRELRAEAARAGLPVEAVLAVEVRVLHVRLAEARVAEVAALQRVGRGAA